MGLPHNQLHIKLALPPYKTLSRLIDILKTENKPVISLTVSRCKSHVPGAGGISKAKIIMGKFEAKLELGRFKVRNTLCGKH